MSVAPAATASPDEPKDVLGVLITDTRVAEDLDYAVRMMSGRPECNVLITGPTGAGKSVLSRHIATDVLGLTGVETVVLRKGDPQMLVTQLRGARRGEYTGAVTTDGAIQRCIRHRRALFLDEVQNLDEIGQQVLLPLLEVRDRHFGGLTGASQPLACPLQILLGTNVDVRQGRWAEHFRHDLWWRMSAVQINLPGLSSRSPEVVYRFLHQMLAEAGADAPERVFTPRALRRTTTWSWPGNLRQLRVFADRAASVSVGDADQRIDLDDLPRLGIHEAPHAQEPAVRAPALDRAMVDHVLQALGHAGWVQKTAARTLDMSPSRLNKSLRRHGLLDEVRKRRRTVGRTRSGPSVR